MPSQIETRLGKQAYICLSDWRKFSVQYPRLLFVLKIVTVHGFFKTKSHNWPLLENWLKIFQWQISNNCVRWSYNCCSRFKSHIISIMNSPKPQKSSKKYKTIKAERKKMPRRASLTKFSQIYLCPELIDRPCPEMNRRSPSQPDGRDLFILQSGGKLQIDQS